MDVPNWFIEALGLTINGELESRSPILSGNMWAHIQVVNKTEKEITICISGPSYNISEWMKTGAFEYTGEYDYAKSVNDLGAFGGRSKKSKGWVNKVLVEICEGMGKSLEGMIGREVEVKNEL